MAVIWRLVDAGLAVKSRIDASLETRNKRFAFLLQAIIVLTALASTALYLGPPMSGLTIVALLGTIWVSFEVFEARDDLVEPLVFAVTFAVGAFTCAAVSYATGVNDYSTLAGDGVAAYAASVVTNQVLVVVHLIGMVTLRLLADGVSRLYARHSGASPEERVLGEEYIEEDWGDE